MTEQRVKIRFLCSFLVATATMKQQGREERQTKRRQTMDRLCSVSGLLLSVACCIALIHVELRIQEHHRLISHSVTAVITWREKFFEKYKKITENGELWLQAATGRRPKVGFGNYVTDIFHRGILSCVICHLPDLLWRAWSFLPRNAWHNEIFNFPSTIEFRDLVQWKKTCSNKWLSLSRWTGCHPQSKTLFNRWFTKEINHKCLGSSSANQTRTCSSARLSLC